MFSRDAYLVKGQLISKGLFDILEFFQKTNEQIRFFEEFEDTKVLSKSFDLYHPTKFAQSIQMNKAYKGGHNLSLLVELGWTCLKI